MSYARWHTKHSWYIFWHCASGESRDEQQLAVWYTRDPKSPLYDYEQLKRDREWVWNDIRERQDKDRMYNRAIFDECIDEWLEEVEETFPVGVAPKQEGE